MWSMTFDLIVKHTPASRIQNWKLKHVKSAISHSPRLLTKLLLGAVKTTTHNRNRKSQPSHAALNILICILVAEYKTYCHPMTFHIMTTLIFLLLLSLLVSFLVCVTFVLPAKCQRCLAVYDQAISDHETITLHHQPAG